MPKIPALIDMLKAGVHFGHQTAKWHPKMKQYIYTVRHGIHIIDLEKTAQQLDKTLVFLRDVAAGGGTIMFASLKKQADETVREAAIRTSMPYLTERWLGGIFTNFSVISKLFRSLDTFESEKQRGVLDKYSKREQLEKQRDYDKLNLAVGGLRTMTKIPQAVVLFGTREGKHAIREAHKAGVPVVALVDTNTNPSLVDYIIPCNDDALRSIQLMVSLFAEAILEGKKSAGENTTVAGR